MNKKIKTIIITGPTASGKTALAVDLARKFDGEIISADSRQVYKGLDLGTGKDLADYAADGNKNAVPYHLIDNVELNEEYNLLRFCNDCANAIKDIANRGKLPIICGGTPLYINAIIDGYKLPGAPPDEEQRKLLRSKSCKELTQILKDQYPETAKDFKDWLNVNRLARAIEKSSVKEEKIKPIIDDIEYIIMAPFFHRKVIHQRIEQRLDQRLEEGMIEEVRNLHDNGATWKWLDFLGLEYRYVSQYLQQKCTKKEMRDQLLIKIRQFAKRQDIWFRKMERENKQIYWLKKADINEAIALTELFLDHKRLPEPKIKIKDIKY
ncbi:tRNA (adenosine(37)-N6)-dimethylallyltransferase MiaA [Lentisphaerota bacterium WC36G]|nr:tRNA (adenosine(37)-N6)-dimethylallyltransferase MiaA [Lentisphaerae bacterium WC36]